MEVANYLSLAFIFKIHCYEKYLVDLVIVLQINGFSVDYLVDACTLDIRSLLCLLWS